jgi:hypothetical protein
VGAECTSRSRTAAMAPNRVQLRRTRGWRLSRQAADGGGKAGFVFPPALW